MRATVRLAASSVSAEIMPSLGGRSNALRRSSWWAQLRSRFRSDWGFIRGWNGCATILWEDRALALDVTAPPTLSTFILYSPSADAGFFCFEPVSHTVDAHICHRGPEAHGLVVLSAGNYARH